MIKVNELFSGIGAFRKALENLEIPHEIVGISEIDKYAIKSYEAIYGETRNYGDISEIDKLDYADLWTYGFPCFTGDSLVLTDRGYMQIKDIRVGDKVLTHKNRYKTVIRNMTKGEKNILRIRGMGVDEIKTTENHRFLIREKSRVWDNEFRKYKRVFGDPKWKEVKDLTRDDYLGIAINQTEMIPKWEGVTFDWSDGRKGRHKNILTEMMSNEIFWWVVGRYFADGWLRDKGVVFGIGKEKSEIFEAKVSSLFHITKDIDKTVNKYIISSRELKIFLEQFGRGAENKHLTNTILNLPRYLLIHFLDGYFSGDGWYDTKSRLYKCCSVSKKLIYGIGQCIAKCYHRPFSIYKTERPPTHIIKGRTVNQKPYYSLTFKKETRKQDKAFYENGHIWFPLWSVERIGRQEVFDIEVEDDHSFTVQNIMVHNCQDISVAGKGAGIVKGETRSGLLYEVERLLLKSQNSGELPKYLIMENVKNLVSKKFIADFERWLEFLKGLGYTNHWQVLNAKDYGIPQNRERVFCISILENEEFIFPEKQPLKLRLKDLLEDEVDEKFYLSQEQVDRIKFSTFNTQKSRIQEKDYCDTLCARDWKDPKCVQIGQYDTPTRTNSNRYRVYDEGGLSPTIQTYQGGNLQPSIKIKNGTKRGFLDAVDGDGIDLAFPASKQRRGRVQKQIASTLDTSPNKGVAIYSPTVCIGSTQKNAAITNGSYAPTLTSSMGAGGGHVPMIDTEPLGTLYAHNSKAFGNGYMNDLSKTLKAEKHDTCVVLGTKSVGESENPMTSPRVVGGIGEKTSNNGKQYFYQNRIYDTGVATAVATSLQPNYLDNAFRVRKLTPKECWRLMGFDDESFEKAAKVCSNTQLYKQAGNSIVVQVLERILENLLLDRPWEKESISRSEWLDSLLGGEL